MSRIRANTITNLTIDGPPTVSTGLQVTGICTATSFDGSIAGFVTAIGSGVNLTGITTIAGITTADSQGVRVAGVVTATTFKGDTAVVGSAVTITSGGQTLINTTNNGGNAEYPLIVSGRANDATDSGRVNIKRGEAAASMTAGDSIGDITFTALDGGNAAQIAVKAGTGWGGTSDSPGELLFQTTPDGSGTLAERMRITSNGGMLLSNGILVEHCKIVTTAWSTTNDISLDDGNVFLNTANLAGTNNTIDITSSNGIANDLAVGDMTSVTLITAVNSASSYINEITIYNYNIHTKMYIYYIHSKY